MSDKLNTTTADNKKASNGRIKHCLVCGRRITSKASIDLGMGQACYNRYLKQSHATTLF